MVTKLNDRKAQNSNSKVVLFPVLTKSKEQKRGSKMRATKGLQIILKLYSTIGLEYRLNESFIVQ